MRRNPRRDPAARDEFSSCTASSPSLRACGSHAHSAGTSDFGLAAAALPSGDLSIAAARRRRIGSQSQAAGEITVGQAESVRPSGVSHGQIFDLRLRHRMTARMMRLGCRSDTDRRRCAANLGFGRSADRAEQRSAAAMITSAVQQPAPRGCARRRGLRHGRTVEGADCRQIIRSETAMSSKPKFVDKVDIDPAQDRGRPGAAKKAAPAVLPTTPPEVVHVICDAQKLAAVARASSLLRPPRSW